MAVVTDSLLLDLLLALIPVTYLAYWYFTNNDDYWTKRGVPYSSTSLLILIVRKMSQLELEKEIYDSFSGHMYVGMLKFKKPVLMVRDPNLINNILVKDFTYFPDRGIPPLKSDIFKGNLFSTSGQRWRALRYKLTQTFTTGKLKGMFEQISNCGDTMIAKIEELSNENAEIECKAFLFEFTLDVISSCTFGLQFKPNSPDFKMFKTSAKNLFDQTILKFLTFAIVSLSPKFADLLNLKLFSQTDEDYFMNLVKSTLKYRKENNIHRNDYFQLLMTLKDQEESGKDMVTTVSDGAEEDELINQMHYVQQNNKQPTSKMKLFTDETLCANSFIFLLAGSETMSTTISSILFELSRHPDIQRQLQREVDSVLAKHKGWNYEAIKEMAYLDQVVQESQRLYPAMPLVIRECSQNYKVPDSDLVIEKGVIINIPVWSLHRDPQYYPEPDQFKPERFEGNNYRPNPTYLPFGDGPRICIAVRFVVMEVKTCVARIMSEYSVKLGTKTQLPVQFDPKTLTPTVKGGTYLSFERRKPQT